MAKATEPERFFYRCIFFAADSEEQGYRLIELGALGTELCGQNAITAYFSGDADIAVVLEEASREGLHCRTVTRLRDEDWLKLVTQSFPPVEVGTFYIVPKLPNGDLLETPSGKKTVRIVPSTGFGTGQHSSTRLALELLERSGAALLQPESRMADVGTGSGVLAIAAVKLFGCYVHAFEVDELAVDNAKENVVLNGCEDRIAIFGRGLDEGDGPYRLIAANLYAELLLQYEAIFRASVEAQGGLLLSGILAEKWEQIAEGYREWRLVEQLADGNWRAGWFCAR